jgi:multiple sugar transport system substrate-binding protein
MTRKMFLLGVLFLLTGLFVFARGSQQQSAPAGSRSQPVTVKYAFWGSPQALGVEAEIVAAFEAKNPNIKIEPVVSGYGDYHTKLLTMIAGGSAPDVMRISTQFLPDLVASKGLVDIGKMAREHNYDLSKYFKEGLDDCSWEGVLYGLPWGTAPIYALLNLAMFEEAGVPPPSYDWTIDEFVQITKALTSGSGADKKYGFAMEIQGDLYGLYPFLWANGGQLLDESRRTFMLDKPEAYEAIQQLAELYQGGYIPPETLLIGTHSASMPSWFINNKLAICLGAAATVLSAQNGGAKFGVWPLPSGKTTHTTVVKSNTTSISASTQYPEEAWKFVTFARGDEGETFYTKAKRVPPSIDDPKYWDFYIDPNLYPQNIKEVTGLIFEKYGNIALVRRGYLELEQLLTPVLQNVLLGNVTAERAMKDIAPRAQAILDKTN